MKNILKAWLKKNELTPDKNDYTAVVSPMGSINQAGLIESIREEGIELAPETLNDVITRYNRHAARYAVSGWNVDSGLVYLRPVITGVFYDKTFDPAINSVYISATQGMEIRRELKETSVSILGEMPDVMHIFQVINLRTKLADGTLTRGRNAQVDGTYIKLTGDDPSVGVYLENVDTGEQTKLEDDYIVTNDPSRLILLIPADLAAGTYRLKIISQFTGANKQLKSPRQVVYNNELTVI
ncbi:MAG: DUF4469 domain-containing protein [Prevotellaceae bacterium]|jgi:hypothetical protein|nr:DUF4469 domain-containing protein [Prevotellaceae bacterium]